MSRTQLKPYYSVKKFFWVIIDWSFFTAKCCCYQLKGAGNALSKENDVVSVTGNDRNTVCHSTTYSGARRAIQNANQVHKISSGPLRTTYFFAFVVARWVEEGALCLVALTTSIWKRSEQMMLASTGRTVLCQTLILVIAIMRQRALPNASIAVSTKTTRFSAMLIFLSILGLEPQPIRS